MSLKILYVVNDQGFFLSHRLPLAERALEKGWDVHVATPHGADTHKIEASGMQFHPIEVSRSGTHPLQELRLLASLTKLYRQLRPDIVHHVTIKPVIWGGFAARWAGVPLTVNAITGLGYVFTSPGRLNKMRRWLVERLYRFALSNRRSRVIFQNSDDRWLFVNCEIVPSSRTVVIIGSGVDPDIYRATEEPSTSEPIIAFVGRYLRDKGLTDFVEAARLVRDRGANARFVIVGSLDPGNPSSVDASDVEQWVQSGLIEDWGQQGDMLALYSKVNIVCLPSHGGEGAPKVLIEAASCSRVCVTTDVPGCREIVEHKRTGLIVPAKSPVVLADTIELLIGDPELRRRMGSSGRRRVVDHLSLTRVVEETFRVYESQVESSAARAS